jgi:hypothetical protein
MVTRDGQVPTRHPDVVVTSSSPADPAPDDGASPGPPRRPVVIVLAVVLALAVVVTLVLALLAGDRQGDEDVGTTPPRERAGAEPSGPAALALTVDAPETVPAGEPARFTVRWSDGSGLFSGSSEDWGDGVATSSLKQGRCEPGAPAPDPAAGSYQAEHSWTEPGSYTVVIGVATYVCDNGTAVVEDASRTLTVEVLPAG